MEALEKLFRENRQWRLYHKAQGAKGSIEAAACAIREQALLDAMVVLQYITPEEARKKGKL